MKRKNIMILMISLSLVLLLGSSYALLRSSKVGSNSYVINVGTLQVTFVDSETEFLNLTNMYPMSDKEGSSQDKELSFMVKNTGNVDSYYDVTLEETSTNPEFKSVIRYIINKDEKGYNEPKTLGENKFIEVGGYLKPNESSNYKVKVWLDYNADNTYMDKEFKAKVVVNSFQESEYAKDVIQNQLVKYSESSKEDFTGGLVAVNTDGDLYNETESSQEIREYRYSGLSVNNYVIFNEETWRIIGVFKDESGAEHLKIVRNENLKGDIMPSKFNAENEKQYSIRDSSTDNAYWNSGGGTNNNDWATAGLQYWLNAGNDVETKNSKDGYMSYLSKSAKGMIEETKYYLGTVTLRAIDDNYGIIDTPKEAYHYERAVEGCDGGVGLVDNNTIDKVESNVTCRVWANNQATWNGKVALMYPTDFGFSTNSNSEFWDTKMYNGTFNVGPSNTSWLQINSNHNYSEWLLSPSSGSWVNVTYWRDNGFVYNRGVSTANTVRPTLYLKSNVKIISGTGEEKNPYILSEN